MQRVDADILLKKVFACKLMGTYEVEGTFINATKENGAVCKEKDVCGIWHATHESKDTASSSAMDITCEVSLEKEQGIKDDNDDNFLSYCSSLTS